MIYNSEEEFRKSGEWCPTCFSEVQQGHFDTFPDHHMNWTPTDEEFKADPLLVNCPTCGEIKGNPCIQTRWGKQSFCFRRFSEAYKSK